MGSGKGSVDHRLRFASLRFFIEVVKHLSLQSDKRFRKVKVDFCLEHYLLDNCLEELKQPYVHT